MALNEMPPTQAGHSLAIDTPLGKDVLLLTSLEGSETVSRGFVYTIEVLTKAADADVRTLLGKPVTLWLHNESDVTRRPLHGHIRHLKRQAVDLRGFYLWQAEVAPWLWFLTHSVDCRIYQHLSIPEILRSVFDEYGVEHYGFRLREEYPKLGFCVQYRESAFAFVSRLMEHIGICYWFEHDKDRHLLVLADSSQLAEYTTPRQVTLAERGDLGEIQEFTPSYQFRPGNWALSDFDFEVPTKTLHTREQTILDIDLMKRFEVFDYPGSYLVRDRGSYLTRLRLEAEEAQHHRISGAGSWVGMEPGKRFVLAPDRSDRSANNETYFITEVRHSAREPRYFPGAEDPASYSNQFCGIPYKTPFRPERLTQWPVMHGPQTATVVGPPGETIHTDEYGRVKVLFHWDRHGKRDDTASCWVRVSQHSVGSHWGSLAIPHCGQEVVIGFLDGDPDRPLVIGRVHNGTNMPPLELPRDKHKTVIRDQSDNRIVMHGKLGQERLSIVSPKNINFVAMRSAAKPLSAQTIDNVDFDEFKDGASLVELQAVWTQLQSVPANSKDGAKVFTSPSDPVPGTAVPAPKTVSQTAPEGANMATNVDINSLSEHDINSLSVLNTNAWVGQNMNTWVKGDMNSEVEGKTSQEFHGGSDALYHDYQSQKVLGDNNTFVLGANTQEFVGINLQTTLGGNVQINILESLTWNIGFNQTVNNLTVDTTADKVEALGTSMKTTISELHDVGVKVDSCVAYHSNIIDSLLIHQIHIADIETALKTHKILIHNSSLELHQ
jgi:type VI secretion system secreted protein VgrG